MRSCCAEAIADCGPLFGDEEEAAEAKGLEGRPERLICRVRRELPEKVWYILALLSVCH